MDLKTKLIRGTVALLIIGGFVTLLFFLMNFNILGTIMLITTIILVFLQIGLELRKENAKKQEEKRKEDDLQKQIDVAQKRFYEDLIANDYSLTDDLTIFKATLMIKDLDKIKKSKFYNIRDINVDESVKNLNEFIQSKMNMVKKRDFVSVDIETTGLNVETDRIIQLSAVKVIDLQIVGTFNAYINPKKAITAGATAVNGLTREMLDDCPTIKTIFPNFKEFIGELPLVAHNADFDITILMNEHLRTLKEPFTPKYTCTMRKWRSLSKSCFDKPVSAKLETVVNYLLSDKDCDEYKSNAHDALTDAKATAKIYLKMIG